MYIPKHFEETREQAILGLISSNPLATFVVLQDDQLTANHIPFVMQPETNHTDKLVAHIPRANPLVEALKEPKNCLAIFHGSEGYISPSLYATKQKHGKVVPTWNYCVAHIHGSARIVDDPQWVRRQIEVLTDLNESKRAEPWSVSDAPSNYTEALIQSLVGIEVSIERIEAKTKASQNQPMVNKQSILESIDKEGIDAGFAEFMCSELSK